MARKTDINLRLTTSGKEDLKRALRETGEEGRRMADQIDRAGKKASRGLKAVDDTAGEVRGELEGLTQRLGPAGAGLRALGAGGIAAGAAIGGVALAFGAAVRVGKEALDTFAGIGNEADRLGLATETFQAVTAEMEGQGISVSRLETGMAALAERQSQIIDGQGEMVARLKDTHPELLEQLANLDSQEDRLRAVTKALEQAESATERNRIAYAAFGEAGYDLQRVLLSNEGGLDGLIAKGRDLGLVIEEDLIRRSQTLSTEFDVTAKVLDLQLKAAFVDFGPVALEMVRMLADVAAMANRVADGFRNADERSSGFNQGRMADLARSISQRSGLGMEEIRTAAATGRELSIDDVDTGGMRRGVVQDLRSDIEELNRIAAIELSRTLTDFEVSYRRQLAGQSSDALKAELQEVEQYIGEVRSRYDELLQDRLGREGLGAGDGSDRARQITGENEARYAQSVREAEVQKRVIETLIETAEARELDRRETEAARDAIEAEAAAKAEADRQQRESLALRREAITVLAELGDYTIALAEKEKRLTEMVDADLITAEQRDAALKSYRDGITGVTEAVERWTGVAEQGRSPTQTLQAEIDDLNAAFEAGKIDVDLYVAAHKALAKALGEARKQSREATEEFKQAEIIRRDIEQARVARLSLTEQMAEERTRVQGLVDKGELTPEEATVWLDLYEEKIRSLRGELDLWAEAESILDGVQQGRIRTIEDLGRALLATLAKVIQQAAMAQAQLGGQGIGEFLGGIMNSVLGSFGFGGSAGGGSGSGPTTGPSQTVPSHSGSIVGQPHGELRSMSRGMAGDERLRLVRVGQEIVPAGDRQRIIDYITKGGSGADGPPPAAGAMAIQRVKIDMDIRTEGGRASVEKRQRADGGFDVKVMLRDEVRGMVGRGELDDTLVDRGFPKRTLK